MKKGCCGGTSNKGSMPAAKVKKSTTHPSHMPGKISIQCKRAGTTDPRDLQR